MLGQFSAAVDGVVLAADQWPSLRASQLVQLLSLGPRKRLTRDEVIDALWPQLGPEAGAANLRKAAHHARQALGRQDAVVLQGGEVTLWPGGTVSVDADNFDLQAQAALASLDPAACVEAASAYAGNLLPGSRFEAWAEPARERLRARFIGLLRVSAQWGRLAQEEPTDEHAHRELMTLALAAGNRAAAIRWYGHLRAALQDDLGVTPGRDTEVLYERCVAGLQSTGPAFVGREMARAQLAAWLSMTPGERPAGVVLRGPAGIGKTAFCRELDGMARQRGWTVVAVGAAQPGRAYAVMAALSERLILADRSLLDSVGAPARSVLALLSPIAAPANKYPSTEPSPSFFVIGTAMTAAAK